MRHTYLGEARLPTQTHLRLFPNVFLPVEERNTKPLTLTAYLFPSQDIFGQDSEGCFAILVWEVSVQWDGGEHRRAQPGHPTARLPPSALRTSGCGACKERAYHSPMPPLCPEPATGQTGCCCSSSLWLLPRHRADC